MVYTIDILCPECNEVTPTEPKAQVVEEHVFDRTKVTRLQVINIKGEIVDFEQ